MAAKSIIRDPGAFCAGKLAEYRGNIGTLTARLAEAGARIAELTEQRIELERSAARADPDALAALHAHTDALAKAQREASNLQDALNAANRLAEPYEDWETRARARGERAAWSAARDAVTVTADEFDQALVIVTGAADRHMEALQRLSAAGAHPASLLPDDPAYAATMSGDVQHRLVDAGPAMVRSAIASALREHFADFRSLGSLAQPLGQSVREQGGAPGQFGAADAKVDELAAQLAAEPE